MTHQPFVITVEVVPPAGPNPDATLAALRSLGDLPIDGFSVATNPVATPRMSAMALCVLIRQFTGRPAILHCTTRDHNRLSLQALLWGARALGIDTVLATSGDFVALADQGMTTTVRDLDLFDLIPMARKAGLRVGVTLEPHPEAEARCRARARLERKVRAGAAFAVTQPIYAATDADTLAETVRGIELPVIMGVLPLRSPRHAEFLHHRVAGIRVPETLRKRMHQAVDPIREGLANAGEMLAAARQRFAGVCVMPPFDHYEMLRDLLETDRT